MEVRVSSISIQDTYGIRSVKFHPATVTRIKGPNGSGKTSIARGFCKIFDGGHDPSIIRHGAEKSIFEFTLNDGTVVTRVCEPKRKRKGEDGPVQYKTTLEILDSDGKPRNAPASYLKELGEPVAIDPGRLLALDVTTKPGLDAFGAEVQKVMNLVWTPDEIELTFEAKPLAAKDHEGRPVVDSRRKVTLDRPLPRVEADLDLKGVKKFTADVVEARRRVGHTRDDADGAINSLRQSLPPEDGEDCSTELAKAEATRDELRRQHSERKLNAEGLKNEAMTNARSELSDTNSTIDTDIERRIRELEKERADRKAAASGEFEKKRGIIEGILAEEQQDIEREIGVPLAETLTKIATLKERVESSLRARFTREQIDQQTSRLRAAAAQYDKLTDIIGRLEQTVTAKLADLPIKGLLVSEDGVFLDGTPWQNVNTAKRVDVVLRICALRSGKLGIFFLDDAEHLDSETMAALERGIAEAGFQLVEAIVSDQDGLTIETFEPLAA